MNMNQAGLIITYSLSLGSFSLVLNNIKIKTFMCKDHRPYNTLCLRGK